MTEAVLLFLFIHLERLQFLIFYFVLYNWIKLWPKSYFAMWDLHQWIAELLEETIFCILEGKNYRALNMFVMTKILLCW